MSGEPESREFRGEWTIAGTKPVDLDELAHSLLPIAYNFVFDDVDFETFFKSYIELLANRMENERPSDIPQHGTIKPSKKQTAEQKRRNELWDSIGKAHELDDNTTDKRIVREDISVRWMAERVSRARSFIKVLYKNYKEAVKLVESTTSKKEQDLRVVLAYLNRELLLLSNYYTQLANENILPSKKDAWQRTCNLTSLSMCLNGLGITNIDFIGDWTQLAKIYLFVKEELTNEEMALEDISEKLEKTRLRLANIGETRMPDFLQIVAIYYQMEILDNRYDLKSFSKELRSSFEKAISDFQKKDRMSEQVNIAQNLIAARISRDAYIFRDLPRYFSAIRVGLNLPDKVHDQCYSLAQHEKYWEGEQSRAKVKIDKLKKDIQEAQKVGGSKDKVKDKVAQLNAQINELNALVSKENQDKYRKEHERYHQQDILKIVLPFINTGFQVVVNVKGHYVRLENIEDDGIRYDDPYVGSKKTKGKSTFLSWGDSSKFGFFRNFHLLCRNSDVSLFVDMWKEFKKIDGVEFTPKISW